MIMKIIDICSPKDNKNSAEMIRFQLFEESFGKKNNRFDSQSIIEVIELYQTLYGYSLWGFACL